MDSVTACAHQDTSGHGVNCYARPSEPDPPAKFDSGDEEGRPPQRPLRKPTADSRPMILIPSFPLFIPSPQLCPREALSMGVYILHGLLRMLRARNAREI